eukprot:2968747-Amphidinium_carterae.1
MPRRPGQPSASEREAHEATGHACYRVWCSHCVQGRGRASPHNPSEEGALPEIGADFAYMGSAGPDQMVLLVLKDKRTGSIGATQVPNKGVDSYAL